MYSLWTLLYSPSVTVFSSQWSAWTPIERRSCRLEAFHFLFSPDWAAAAVAVRQDGSSPPSAPAYLSATRRVTALPANGETSVSYVSKGTEIVRETNRRCCGFIDFLLLPHVSSCLSSVSVSVYEIFICQLDQNSLLLLSSLSCLCVYVYWLSFISSVGCVGVCISTFVIFKSLDIFNESSGRPPTVCGDKTTCFKPEHDVLILSWWFLENRWKTKEKLVLYSLFIQPSTWYSLTEGVKHLWTQLPSVAPDQE